MEDVELSILHESEHARGCLVNNSIEDITTHGIGVI